MALGNCNRCTDKQHIELYDKNNYSQFSCWPSPECNDGQEASVEPGSSHPQGTSIHCVPCPNNFFSNNRTNKRCRNCISCGNRMELLSCERSRDRQCSNICISSKYYFNSTDQQCYPCTECCGAIENIEPQCIAMNIGTVIGGKGEKHCKATSKSSEQCDDLPSVVDRELPKANLSSVLCGNSSSINGSSIMEKDSSQQLNIGLACALGLSVSLNLVLLAWLACRKRRGSSRNDYLSSCSCVYCWFTDSSTCAGTCTFHFLSV